MPRNLRPPAIRALRAPRALSWLLLAVFLLAAFAAVGDIVYHNDLNRLLRVIRDGVGAATNHYDPLRHTTRFPRETRVPQAITVILPSDQGSRIAVINLALPAAGRNR